MKYFDPHIHVYSRTVDDYKNMATAGVRAIVEPSFWLGSKRQYPESHLDYFEHVLSFEPKRAREHGIEHYACLGMNPKEANDLELAHAVIDALPEFLKRDNCVAIGETGFDLISKEEEENHEETIAAGQRSKHADHGSHPSSKQTRRNHTHRGDFKGRRP